MSDHAAQIHKRDKGKMVHKSNGNDFLALVRAKSKEFELIRVDVNQMYTVCRKSIWAAEDVNLKSYAPKSAENPIADRKKFEIGESSAMRRSMELFNDEAIFSEKISTQQLTETTIKWKNLRSYNCQNSDAYQPGFEHFPMFNINRKIEAIMASNKKNTHGAMSVKIKKESLSLHEKMLTPLEGLQPDNSANIVEPSSRFFQINGKLLTTGGRGDADSNSSFLGSSWTSVKDGSIRVLRESSPSYSPHPFSSDRHDANEKDDFANRFFLGQKRFRKPDGSDVHRLPCKIPKCSIHDVNLSESFQNFKPIENGELFHKLSSTIKQLPDTDKVRLNGCFREPTMGDNSFAQVKENASLEVRIVLIGPNGKKDMSANPFKNFPSDSKKNDRDVTGAHLIEASNESSTRTDTMYGLPSSQSKSLLGETYSSAQKGVAPSNIRNLESTSSSPAEQAACRTIKTGITGRQVGHPADRPTYASHNAVSTSQTRTMSLDLNIPLAMIADNTSGSETCSIWIKRLQDHHPEALSLCSKRRWSHNYHEVSPSATRAPPGEQQERLKALPEKFEGRLLGSVRAMVLMGRTMRNRGLCKFRRKKTSLVWNTSDPHVTPLVSVFAGLSLLRFQKLAVVRLSEEAESSRQFGGCSWSSRKFHCLSLLLLLLTKTKSEGDSSVCEEERKRSFSVFRGSFL
ncbi:hypothetical protein KSP40_PGU002770 [Platanthera guangdongensis]|uniref:Uncharacterized protein n=1 Tax=Platanthera guangdongensis TaxID=2320717 RepID=A0ABR2M2B7_9ASPA